MYVYNIYLKNGRIVNVNYCSYTSTHRYDTIRYDTTKRQHIHTHYHPYNEIIFQREWDGRYFECIKNAL